MFCSVIVHKIVIFPCLFSFSFLSFFFLFIIFLFFFLFVLIFDYHIFNYLKSRLTEDTAWHPVWREEFDSAPALRKAIIYGYGPFRPLMSIAHW